MSAREAMRKSLLGATLLAVAAAVGVAIVAYTFEHTAPQIRENEREVLLATLNEVLPANEYDNALVDDAITVTDPEMLGTTQPVTVYRAFRGGEPVAALFTSVAPDGYSGEIRLLVGVRADGRLSGVRVLAHKETPGLGDPIEIRRSDWITSFDGRALGDPPLERWKVRRDGGVFDQFTGATITPRAVVKAVRNTLIYFERHREELFAQ
ncbi:MAG TPA: electron transport complex subunit RsxG [Gammaproteobacteria bacterium]|nr:electron transport complex subunit RsxG [Gammaproteobacteria bacterium]